MPLGVAGWVGLAGAASTAYAANKGSKQSGAQTTTNTQTMDPRVSEMLFGGSNGNGPQTGLLPQFQGMLGAPQDPMLAQYGKDNLGYLSNAPKDMGAIRDAATGLLGGQPAPQAQAAQQSGMAYNVGNMVKAPAQNGINLSGSYDKFIHGDAGANPYLTKAIQGGIDQSTNQFKQMQGAATENLQENILPGIRSNSVLSGQYGGSRQGIAEGNAIGDHAKAMQQAATQFGQNNTNQAVGAQASSFNQGQDRALSATQGLGAQQYGVASQDAATKNAAEFANVAATNGINAQNTANQQQTNLANLGAQQNNNALNQSGIAQGSSMLGGLLGGAAGVGQGQDKYALNQAQGVNSLLAPHLGQVPGSSTSSQPMYQNTAGNILGGATAGLGLYNQLKGSFGTPGTSAPSWGSIQSGWNSGSGY